MALTSYVLVSVCSVERADDRPADAGSPSGAQHDRSSEIVPPSLRSRSEK